MNAYIFRKKMKKKNIFAGVLFAFCITIIIATASLPSLAADGDEIRASKKIISVVYDDSGSMQGDRWPYSSYSFQALAALLNEQDELYVTYMSNPTSSVKMDTSNLDKTVQEIRNWDKMSGTPVEAVDTAKSKLDSLSESDASAQFWLVIFTDGEMFEAGNTTTTNDDLVQLRLDSFKGDLMSNGTPLNVVYLGMPGAFEMQADVSNNLYTYLVENDSEIVAAVNEISNMVSGRLKADKVSQIDKKTVSVTSDLPIYSLSILSQRSAAVIVKAEFSGQKLNVERNISLDARNLKNGTAMPTLYGNAGIINNRDKNGLMTYIPAGSYEISFSEEVDIKDMMIQYEPAISMMAEIQRNGVVIDDYSVLEEGDAVDIRLLPVIPGTDTVIPGEDLPKQATWTIEYEVEGAVEDSYRGDILTGVVLKKGSNIIRGSFTIPGYAPLICEIPFEVSEHIEIIHEYGIDVFQPDNSIYLRDDFKHGFLNDNNTVRFAITEDGIPMSAEQLQNENRHLIITGSVCTPSQNLITKLFGKVPVSCSLKQNDKGEYSLIVKRPGIVPVLFLKTGDYKVTVAISEDNTITNYGTFSVDSSIKWIEVVLPFIILILFIYLLYILFIKKKFRGQTLHYECWEIADDGEGIIMPGSDSKKVGFLSGHFLAPRRASYVNYKGLKFFAGSDGMIIISGKSIAKRVYSYGNSVYDPETSLQTLADQLTKTERNGKREVADRELTSNPVYFRDSEDSEIIWKMWMTR